MNLAAGGHTVSLMHTALFVPPARQQKNLVKVKSADEGGVASNILVCGVVGG